MHWWLGLLLVVCALAVDLLIIALLPFLLRWIEMRRLERRFDARRRRR